MVPFSALPGILPTQEVLPQPVAPAPALVLPPPASPVAPRRGAAAPKPSQDPSARPAPAPVMPRENLLRNPSLERSAAPWSTWHGALGVSVADDAPDGGRAARVRFNGVGNAYSLGHLARRVAVAEAGVPLAAQAFVRSASPSSAGKPLSLYIREVNPRGRVVRRVRGTTVRLGETFTPLTATLTPRSRRNRVNILLVQRRAAAGDAFLADALSITAKG